MEENRVKKNNFNHRRSVAASLVRGVYTLEYDRQQNRRAFYFRVHHSVQNAPDYVIAIRGTINKPDTVSRDLKLDIRCVRNRLHESSRYQLAMQAVWSIIDAAGTSRIWLAGHSLGSAISLLVGKNVTKMCYSVEAYLFNPPFSASIEIIKDGIRITTSLVKAGLAAAKGHHWSLQPDGPYMLLSKWIPYLFVNPADPISLCKSPDFKRAHGIHQGWDPSFDGQSELHEYK
ncbi:hypothetical protein F3Y22_tig00013773pilonHSYRG00009 [Hibiscus syriacus]|uniref:Fungal lipase-type domain-containing protein n=1 Tax=Hibiscus syriacus TaxID=106335 RepID=A0A6A3C3P2_HIBSY|nr:hypothetical protein F3Y22_tig00013773pilonHSYRG00009 [Hibiscus syriacus]